jgi:hypothetical protein
VVAPEHESWAIHLARAIEAFSRALLGAMASFMTETARLLVRGAKRLAKFVREAGKFLWRLYVHLESNIAGVLADALLVLWSARQLALLVLLGVALWFLHWVASAVYFGTLVLAGLRYGLRPASSSRQNASNYSSSRRLVFRVVKVVLRIALVLLSVASSIYVWRTGGMTRALNWGSDLFVTAPQVVQPAKSGAEQFSLRLNEQLRIPPLEEEAIREQAAPRFEQDATVVPEEAVPVPPESRSSQPPAQVLEGRVVVVPSPPDSSIAIDGVPVATQLISNEGVFLAGGFHSLRVEKKGYRGISQSINVEPGATVRLSVPLEPVLEPSAVSDVSGGMDLSGLTVRIAWRGARGSDAIQIQRLLRLQGAIVEFQRLDNEERGHHKESGIYSGRRGRADVERVRSALPGWKQLAYKGSSESGALEIVLSRDAAPQG